MPRARRLRPPTSAPNVRRCLRDAPGRCPSDATAAGRVTERASRAVSPGSEVGHPSDVTGRGVSCPTTARVSGRRVLGVLAALGGLLAIPVSARAALWLIDPDATKIEFTVRVLAGSSASGVFRRVAGTVRLDEQNPSRSTIEATIDAASIDTQSEERDRHLRSEDFLDVERHPTIRFSSRALDRDPDGRWRVTGSLTLRGITRDATLVVDAVPPFDTLPRAGRAQAHATMVIDRRDFGLTYRGFAWGREVTIMIDAGAQRSDR